jgi:hypothetical protein
MPSSAVRFIVWAIQRYVAHAIILKDTFDVIPFEDMNDDERKWAWLFMKSVHKRANDVDDYDKYVADHSTLDAYEKDLEKYEDTRPPATVDDDVKEVTDEMKNVSIEMKRATIENPLIPSSMINRGLVDVAKLSAYLRGIPDIPQLLVANLNVHITMLGPTIGYGVSYVRKTDVDRVTNAPMPITPTKKQTDDEKTNELNKRKEASDKTCVEMGLRDKNEDIGQLMVKLAESCEVDTKRVTMGVDAMETVVNSGFEDVDVMKDVYDQIETRLSGANNDGIRLVNLRGIIFGLYMMRINADGVNNSIDQTAVFFQVSRSMVLSSRSFSALLFDYPMFRRVTLSFTVISRNAARIRTWLETASLDVK